MNSFVKVHAQFVRRVADGLEVEFLSKHELRYSKADSRFILYVETYIAEDGASDGCTVNVSGLKLNPDARNEVEMDLTSAASPLLTKFHFI